MSRKVQLLVGFLVLTTLLAGWQLLGILHFPATLAKILPASSGALAEPENDTDHDGLVDHDESYWNTDFQDPDTDDDGYKDGEEVASGHDPLLPGPDDVLLSNNVTQQVSELVVAGLYEGSLRPENKNFDSALTEIADSVIGVSADISELPYKLIPVLDANEDKARYENAIRSHFTNLTSILSPRYTGDSDSWEKILGSAEKDIRDLLAALAILPTPKSYESVHLSFMQFLNALAADYRGIIASENDPVRQVVLINNTINLIEDDLPIIIERYQKSFRH